jgi:uncharacterized protein (DUF1501 family)
MDPLQIFQQRLNRRQFLAKNANGLGKAALASLFGGSFLTQVAKAITTGDTQGITESLPSFAPKAKRAIFLFMAGAPSQIDLWDYKPRLVDMFDKDLPSSVINGQRLTGMTSGQARFPIAPSIFKFNQYGKSGTWVSELLPWTSKIVDDICLIKSVYTEQINHEPAITFIQTGNQNAGKACLGSWLSYGLGSLNENLPTFVVLTSKFSWKVNTQALSSRLWSSGFLPSQHSGVALRGAGDPVLYLSNPCGVDCDTRRMMLDSVGHLDSMEHDLIHDPETEARISQYEMAFRMQSSVPELTDISKEPEITKELYGPQVTDPGTFAANCLLARRLLERGTRFVQVFHRGWDVHSKAPEGLRAQCGDIDQGCYGLITDLKQRGMLEDTLVIWGGEFGRTVYSQGNLTRENYGRDHHPRCFTVWMAGAGIKPGFSYGATDDFCYNILENPVHIRDMNATILNRFGIDANSFNYKFQGLDQRLVGVEKASVVEDILT